MYLLQEAVRTKALFTRNVCIWVNFNIVLMVTQMHMQRMGPTPILCACARASTLTQC